MCKIISDSDNKSSEENKMGREGGEWVVVGGLFCGGDVKAEE